MQPGEELRLRRVEAADLSQVARLVDEAVGEGFFDDRDVDTAVSHCALREKLIVGAVVASFLPADAAPTLPDRLRTAVDRVLRPVEAAGTAGGPAARILHVRELAVAASERGRGLGGRLLRASAEAGWREGAVCAIAFAWTPADPDRHTSSNLFRRLGWLDLGLEEDFYAAASLEAGSICPVCGPPPCRCAARLFFKDIRPS